MSGREAINKYVTCREDCNLRYIEALALNGFVKGFEVIDCGNSLFKKVRVKLVDGSLVESKCSFHEEVGISVRIIASYIGFYRSRKMLGEITVVDKGGEVV
ncbi:MAG: hypothetical protein N3E36_01970 [Sulfolobales archaeon]|nr:hypothetical protein [Sulfolobales archaeon]MCX8198781.1 hypothetical protein [Sulfolobales archaeon]MDW8169854.1 hypothetical protein [Desulfurococcaceae archaeon]